MMLPKPNFSYTTYEYIESLPVLIFPLIFFIVSLFVTCLAEKKYTVKNVFLDIFYGPPLAVLTSMPGTKSKERKFYIASNEVSGFVSWCLYFIGMLFVPSSFIVFWDLFVFTESHVCDDLTIDCFSSPLYEIVNNCTDYKDLDVEFICFRFTFSFGIGLAAVGGVFTALQIIVKLISRFCIWFYKQIPKKGRWCVYVLISSLSITASIVDVALYSFVLPYHLYEHYPFAKILAIYWKFGIFVLTFTISVCTPWHIITQERDNDLEQNTTDEQQPPYSNESEPEQPHSPDESEQSSNQSAELHESLLPIGRNRAFAVNSRPQNSRSRTLSRSQDADAYHLLNNPEIN